VGQRDTGMVVNANTRGPVMRNHERGHDEGVVNVELQKGASCERKQWRGERGDRVCECKHE
jgi:hypothetical protein